MLLLYEGDFSQSRKYFVNRLTDDVMTLPALTTNQYPLGELYSGGWGTNYIFLLDIVM